MSCFQAKKKRTFKVNSVTCVEISQHIASLLRNNVHLTALKSNPGHTGGVCLRCDRSSTEPVITLGYIRAVM